MIPFNASVTWAMKKFGWKDEDAPDFNLLQTIKDTWTTARDKIKQGFVDFGNWLASIPSKIKLMAVQTIDAATPDWLIDMSDDIEAARAAVASFNINAEKPTTGQEAAAIIYDDAIMREARANQVAITAVDQSSNDNVDNSTNGTVILNGDNTGMSTEDESSGWSNEYKNY